jgi:hypothetical protein
MPRDSLRLKEVSTGSPSMFAQVVENLEMIAGLFVRFPAAMEIFSHSTLYGQIEATLVALIE